jgi:RimJ/RimL family protein N-acetyltransferase
MTEIRLIQITRDGAPAEAAVLCELATEACASMAALYRRVGFTPPWVGYLAVCGSDVVGTCAFKAAPVRERVEIAYYTFPPHEGRGMAAAMAAQLIHIARTERPVIEVIAQTLPERNASNRILEKLGFELSGVAIDPEDGPVWQWRLPPRI